MKHMLRILTTVAIATSCICHLSSCEEEKIDTRGVVLVSVRDGNSNEPVVNATVKVYKSLDDWSDDLNVIVNIQTNNHGEIILPRLQQWDEYVVDVTKGALSNWNNPVIFSIENSEVKLIPVFLTENFNTLISQVGGKSWTVVKVTDASGVDLSAHPDFSCLIGNRESFHKSGYYEIDRGPSLCDPDPDFTSGSWWNSYDYALYIFPVNDPNFFFFTIASRSAESFTLSGIVSGEEVNIKYELSH